MEESKSMLPALITAAGMKLKITAELPKHKLTLPELETRGLTIIKNRDSLPIVKQFLADGKKIKDVAEEVFKRVKQPYWDAGKECDAGKKLVFEAVDLIVGEWQKWYDKELAAVAEETRLQKIKINTEKAILKGIEDNIMTFSNMIVAAVSKKQLLAVESRINLEKSPSMTKKYGEFHAQAIERYDSVLLPIIKDQKKKVDEIDALNVELLAAEANNDPDKMDELMAKVDEKSNEILQNHAVVQEAALNQESFAVLEATEVLPEVKTKRTNYSFEIADLEVALKKARELLEITIDNKKAREVLEKLKEEKAFEGKDFVIRDGIKYIATRVREAL